MLSSNPDRDSVTVRPIANHRREFAVHTLHIRDELFVVLAGPTVSGRKLLEFVPVFAALGLFACAKLCECLANVSFASEIPIFEQLARRVHHKFIGDALRVNLLGG